MDCKSNPETPKTREEARRLLNAATDRVQTLLEKYYSGNRSPELCKELAEAYEAAGKAAEEHGAFAREKAGGVGGQEPRKFKPQTSTSWKSWRP